MPATVNDGTQVAGATAFRGGLDDASPKTLAGSEKNLVVSSMRGKPRGPWTHTSSASTIQDNNSGMIPVAVLTGRKANDSHPMGWIWGCGENTVGWARHLWSRARVIGAQASERWPEWEDDEAKGERAGDRERVVGSTGRRHLHAPSRV